MGSQTAWNWAPAFPRIAAMVLASLLRLLPGGASPATAQTRAVAPAPNVPALVEASHPVASPGDPSGRVRPMGPAARVLLEAGAGQSETVARLLGALGQSDLLVYVTTGFLTVPGRLDFACARHGVRYLRITINVPDAEAKLVAALAHELQHAVEIARAPEVTDAASLAAFYRHHGQRTYGDHYCTREAQRVTDVVRCEVAAAASARR